MDKIGRYVKKPFSKHRRDIALFLGEGKRKHSIHSPIEIDITEGRRRIRVHARETGKKISFTGWIIYCIATAMKEQKELNAYRHGSRRIVVFDDVDVGIPVERTVNGEHLTMAYIIRKANEKSVEDLTTEIRQVQKEEVDDKTQIIGEGLTRFEGLVLKSPWFFKKLMLWVLRRNAFMKKKHMGTVGVTAIGMLGKYPGWVIPLGGTSNVLIAVGGISKKPGVVDDRVVVREYLDVTVTVDHDLIDGGPLVRFIARLCDLMENGYGLPGE
ncbi:MAG: 2-oxo acid dehydrogenase subunit E2 [Thermoplasmatota archaeon]